MTKVIARPLGPVNLNGFWRQEYINPVLVNRGDWYGQTYLLIVGGHIEDVFVVEAGDESEVVDNFVDSKYGDIIVMDETDVEDEENQARAGNESKPVDLTYVHWRRCKVDYGDYLLSKDNSQAFEDYVLDEIVQPENVAFLVALAVKHAWDELSEHFNNDWLDYVNEQNTEKSDDEYNKTIAGKETKDV